MNIMKNKLVALSLLSAIALTACSDATVCSSDNSTINAVSTNCNATIVPIPSDVTLFLKDRKYDHIRLNGELISAAIRQEVELRVSQLERGKRIEVPASNPIQPDVQNTVTPKQAVHAGVVGYNNSDRETVVDELKHAEEMRLKAQVKLDKIDLDDRERVAEMMNELEHLRQKTYRPDSEAATAAA